MRAATVICAFALTLGLAAPPECAAQEKVVEDLGDGFQAVSVNGGPPAIVDTRSGLILKLINGSPAVVDTKAKAYMLEGEDGEPVVKYYGWKGKGGGDDGEQAKPDLGRMKAFMKRVKAHAKVQEGLRKGKQATKKKPAAKRKTRVELLLELLGAKGEEAKVFADLLRGVLRKQDEIRASSLDLIRLAKGKPSKKQAKRSARLPAAITTFQATFRALRAGQAIEEATLKAQLAAFRAARKLQDKSLAKRRAKLREVLTVVQEAKLTAVGVLD